MIRSHVHAVIYAPDDAALDELLGQLRALVTEGLVVSITSDDRTELAPSSR